MIRTFYFRRMSLGDPNSFRDLKVSVPDDLSELANKTRADLGEEEQLEANSHPDLPTSFDITELPSHWDGKQKENPSGADEPEPPAKRNQFQARAIPANQLCPIPDLNKLPTEQEDNGRTPELATDGFVPSTLQKGEQFLRQAFQHLQDSVRPYLLGHA
jgi:hypothetical protein